MRTLVYVLYKLVAFVYYVNHYFIAAITEHTLAILRISNPALTWFLLLLLLLNLLLLLLLLLLIIIIIIIIVVVVVVIVIVISYSLRVFYWSLRKSKSPQVFRNLLSILTDLNNAVVWMVSTCPLISKYSNLFAKFLGIVPSALITIGITVTFIFHSFF